MKNITIYSTTVCKYCNAAKSFFKDHGVNYTEYNVGTDAAKRQEMMTKSGQLGVPVIDIDGEIIVGYNERRLNELFGAQAPHSVV